MTHGGSRPSGREALAEVKTGSDRALKQVRPFASPILRVERVAQAVADEVPKQKSVTARKVSGKIRSQGAKIATWRTFGDQHAPAALSSGPQPAVSSRAMDRSARCPRLRSVECCGWRASRAVRSTIPAIWASRISIEQPLVAPTGGDRSSGVGTAFRSKLKMRPSKSSSRARANASSSCRHRRRRPARGARGRRPLRIRSLPLSIPNCSGWAIEPSDHNRVGDLPHQSRNDIGVEDDHFSKSAGCAI